MYTHKSIGRNDKSYTHKTLFKTKTKIIVTHSHTYPPPCTEAVTHITVTHPSACTVHSRENRLGLFVCWDLVSMFVCCASANRKLASWGSLSSWRGLFWLAVCVSPVCVCALVSEPMLICINMCLNGCLDACVNAQAGACLGMFWYIPDRQAQKPTWLVVFQWRQVPPFNRWCRPTIHHDFL